MFFRLKYITTNAYLDGQVLSVNDPKLEVDLILRERSKDEPGPGFKSQDGVCEASCVRDVPTRLEKEARDKGSLSIRKGLVEKAQNDMYLFVSRALRIVRWRQGAPGGPNPIRLFLSFAWSFDKVEWKEVTDTRHLEVVFGAPFEHWTIDSSQSVQQMLIKGTVEPLGHELLREAASHEHDNPRSAIILAVAAAEVGFKRFVVQIRPETQWLIENLASPPLEKMLVEMLPELPVQNTIRNSSPFVPDIIIEEIRKAVKLRNDLVHGRGDTMKGSTVGAVLLAVRDLLYLLDFYTGIGWASKNISGETLDELRKTVPHKATVPQQ